MNQDKVMKRRMITAIVLMLVSFIALAIFIGLYLDETTHVQDTYKKQYRTEIGHVLTEIDIYLEPEGDHELIYRRVTNYMSNAGAFAFLIDDFTEKQIIVNEVSTALIRYPDQMKEKMEELKTALSDINSELDKGYDELKELYESLDLKGN
ncbi:MAG: hypothetical protein IKP47_11510 [Ruminococcus sp.]|nr:hypothetical protein [Ruminococcus sp.]